VEGVKLAESTWWRNITNVCGKGMNIKFLSELKFKTNPEDI